MAKTVSEVRLQERSARARLAPRHHPYWRSISEGRHLGYYRGQRGGSWIARCRPPEGGDYLTNALGRADDQVEADGTHVLDWRQALDAALVWFDKVERRGSCRIDEGKRGAQIDRATDEIRCLLASADGSEVHSTELERQVDRARAAEAAMLGLEALRETAALLYTNETGSSWRPAGGSRLNHGAALTSAVVDGRDFLRARSENHRRAAMPEGTPVLFAGRRLAFARDSSSAFS
jgi:hypothetical protein